MSKRVSFVKASWNFRAFLVFMQSENCSRIFLIYPSKSSWNCIHQNFHWNGLQFFCWSKIWNTQKFPVKLRKARYSLAKQRRLRQKMESISYETFLNLTQSEFAILGCRFTTHDCSKKWEPQLTKWKLKSLLEKLFTLSLRLIFFTT